MATGKRSSKTSSTFHWLGTGRDGLEAMLKAIGEARTSVRLETYIFDSGPIGQRFREALVAARQRQVRVQVLVDAIGSVGLTDSFWTALREAGGEVRWFNPIKLNRISYRDHRKILVVDDDVAVIGGFNIATEYHGDGVSTGWRDLGLRIRGPLVVELGASVDAMLAQADFKHRRLERLRRAPGTKSVAESNWQLLLSGPGRGHRVMKRTLASDFASAEQLDIVSAYFLPTWRLRREIRRVARRGHRVRIMLAGKSDVRLARLACQRLYQSLLRAGVEIYEYQPQVLHAKLVIVNDIVYAGSANLDARGLGINYEFLVRFRNSSLASQGRAMLEQDLAHCRRITLPEWRKARGFIQRLMEIISFMLLARLDPYLARWQWRKLKRQPAASVAERELG